MHSARGVLCAGFVALDIVDDQSFLRGVSKICAGGTAANIAATAAFLALPTKLLARIGSDRAGQLVAQDLDNCGVRGDLFVRDEKFATPIVIEKLFTGSDGRPAHKFVLRCSHCGKVFPRFRAASRAATSFAPEHLDGIDLMIFDRSTPAILQIASTLKNRGGTIIFEPSSHTSSDLFDRALAAADIVKYSIDRLPSGIKPRSDLNVVETLGLQGLNFLYLRNGKEVKQHSPSFKCANLRDSTGAGDALTSGLIYSMARNKAQHQDGESVLDHLKFGQAFASLNSQFLGARGAMQALERAQMLDECKRIMLGRATAYTDSVSPQSASRAKKIASQILCHFAA